MAAVLAMVAAATSATMAVAAGCYPLVAAVAPGLEEAVVMNATSKRKPLEGVVTVPAAAGA